MVVKFLTSNHSFQMLGIAKKADILFKVIPLK